MSKRAEEAISAFQEAAHGYMAQFVRDRDEALLSLDREKIERFAKKYGVQMPTSEEAFWRGVHKAICNITSVPFEVRQKSADWLFEHGSTPEIGGHET